jgi:hypothetical protein
MRFGDSRVQALAGALCVTLCAVTGITNGSLRALMPGLLGAPYGMTQASYDLARLRRNALITRRPHANTYDLTPDGLAFAIFYTKVHDRVLAPLFAAGQPRPRPSSPPRSARSNTTSTNASPAPGCQPQPDKTRLNHRTPSDKRVARAVLDSPTHSDPICACRPPRRRSASPAPRSRGGHLITLDEPDRAPSARRVSRPRWRRRLAGPVSPRRRGGGPRWRTRR